MGQIVTHAKLPASTLLVCTDEIVHRLFIECSCSVIALLVRHAQILFTERFLMPLVVLVELRFGCSILWTILVHHILLLCCRTIGVLSAWLALPRRCCWLIDHSLR